MIRHSRSVVVVVPCSRCSIATTTKTTTSAVLAAANTTANTARRAAFGDSRVRTVYHGPPTRTSKAWERSAHKVKDTNNFKDNPYLDLIRETHDPTMQLKTLEEEIKGTIGKALGKQGMKILDAVQLMQYEYQLYQQALETYHSADEQQQIAAAKDDAVSSDKQTDDVQDSFNPHPKVVQHAEKYNQYRKDAIQARWELMVHRQAAGFIVNNHKYVMQHYPIPDKLVLPKATSQETNSTDSQRTTQPTRSPRTFGDQLDWWQRIGRWR